MDTAPAATRPTCARLAEGLRELKTRTGLSLAVLAERTVYSKSSWERYLNGKQLAPRQAVEALCTISGEPPERMVALWELAELEWSGRHRTSDPAQHDARPGSRGTSAGRLANGWSAKRLRWVFAAAACVVTLLAAIWATASPDTGTGDTTTGQITPSALPAPGCRGRKCVGEDPEMMGCAGPGQVKTLGSRHKTYTGAWLSFSFSNQCRTAWALVWNAKVGDALEVSIAGSRPQRVKVADAYEAESSLITPMIDGRDLTGLRACFKPAGGGHVECFRR